MTPWTELSRGEDRIRYRPKDRPPGTLKTYDLEYWHSGRQEWRRVPNHSSRDWFALGIEAGRREAGQVEMFGQLSGGDG